MTTRCRNWNLLATATSKLLSKALRRHCLHNQGKPAQQYQCYRGETPHTLNASKGKARKRRAPATHKMAGDCDGASRVPSSKDPKWFIPGPRDERRYEVRVARKPRGNGHTAIAGGRCLDAGVMPPPSLMSITRSSIRVHRQCTLSGLRTDGLSD
jgi:hypothetical protein